jgi:hypothetical protein
MHGSGMWQGAKGDSYIGEWKMAKLTAIESKGEIVEELRSFTKKMVGPRGH